MKEIEHVAIEAPFNYDRFSTEVSGPIRLRIEDEHRRLHLPPRVWPQRQQRPRGDGDNGRGSRGGGRGRGSRGGGDRGRGRGRTVVVGACPL